MEEFSPELFANLVPTEAVNPSTADIDTLPITDVLRRINQEDKKVAEAVGEAVESIAPVVDQAARALEAGGRLLYYGAGTSGRLGILDAVECVPTFGTEPWQVQGFIAGGETALTRAVEGAEDDPELGRRTVEQARVSDKDVVMGISASGNAPYVVAALETARTRGAWTAALTCNPDAAIVNTAHHPVVIPVGPEVIAGSTRMKAGTMQKLVLNMLSTAVMVELGKTYGNLMVDVRPTNEKLRKRARRLVRAMAGCDEETALNALQEADWQVKPATLMARHGLALAEARRRLEVASGKLRKALIQS